MGSFDVLLHVSSVSFYHAGERSSLFAQAPFCRLHLVPDVALHARAQDRWQETPLQDAQRNRHAPVTEFLLANGAKPGNDGAPLHSPLACVPPLSPAARSRPRSRCWLPLCCLLCLRTATAARCSRGVALQLMLSALTSCSIVLPCVLCPRSVADGPGGHCGAQAAPGARYSALPLRSFPCAPAWALRSVLRCAAARD